MTHDYGQLQNQALAARLAQLELTPTLTLLFNCTLSLDSSGFQPWLHIRITTRALTNSRAQTNYSGISGPGAGGTVKTEPHSSSLASQHHLEGTAGHESWAPGPESPTE